MVEEAFLEHLLVEARAVETGIHAQLDVAAQRRVRRRGHDAFRVVALIQHQALKHHLAVELDRPAIDAHGAQCGVRGRLVHRTAGVIHQRDSDVIEMRGTGLPQTTAACGDVEIETRGQIQVGGALGAGHLAIGIAERGAQAHAGRVAGQRLLEANDAAGHVRRQPRSAQRQVRHRLHPHRLPDAGGSDVDGAVRPILAGLLATRLRAVRGVARAHGDDRFLGRRRHAVQVTSKWREPAAMAPYFDAVDPHRGVVVDGLEMQQDAAARPLRRNGHVAAIPDGVKVVVVLDSRQPGLRAKGHGDGAVQLALQEPPVDPAISLIDLELPLAVEAQPMRAHKLRAGILVTRCRHYALHTGARRRSGWRSRGSASPA